MDLRIAICDDEEHIGFQVEEYIKQICSKLNIAVETDVYYSGKGLCEKLTVGECYDLIFLDIELNDIDGVQVGLNIRDEYDDELTQIVYISGKQEYTLKLFDINPLNFLVKPLDYECIEKVIRKFLKIAGFWSDVFTYKIGHDTFKAKMKDIMYFQSNGRKIEIFFKGRTEEIYGSLEDIYTAQLKKYGFLFIHKSYIVNYDYVSVFEYETLYLSGGQKLPIAQSKRKEIRSLQKILDKRRS